MLKAIILDLGGVLLDVYTCPDLITELARITQLEPIAIEELWQKHYDQLLVGNISPLAFLKLLINQYQLKLSPKETLQIWEKSVEVPRSAINYDLINLVLNVRKRSNIKLYILSNMINLSSNDELVQNIKAQFDGYFASYTIGLKKPNPKIFKKLLESIKLKPEECLYVDDDNKYIKVAFELGFHTIHYKNNHELQYKLMSPNFAISRF